MPDEQDRRSRRGGNPPLADPRRPAGSLKFLMDTNVFIAVEPARVDDLEPGSPATAELLRHLGEGGHTVYVHPSASFDIDRDTDDERRAVRQHHFDKYAKVPAPPPVPDGWVEEFGELEPGGNDDVDLRHLAAVRANAVHYLVTEDRRLHRRADRVGLGERVVTVEDALGLLRNLYVEEAAALPTVDPVVAHQLDVDDPIFDSLRDDYPEFDEWFERVQLEHRQGWVIRSHDGLLAAVCLVKDEGDANDAGLPGDAVLKISTFKVSPDHTGNRYGELLLKAVFGHAATHGHDGMYVTVFADRHPALVALLDDFGFYDTDLRTGRGEEVLAKRRPTLAGLAEDADRLGPLDYHVRYGPPALAPADDQFFVVPIKPKFVARLFPDAHEQLQLIETAPCGNAIRKAYLSRANTRQIKPGATLLFYRSSDEQAVFAVGVVDDVLVSAAPDELAAEVGTRTVYSMREIEDMAENDDGGRREILAILFRQDRVLDGAVGLAEMVDNGALNGPPQSITQADAGAADWIRQRIDA